MPSVVLRIPIVFYLFAEEGHEQEEEEEDVVDLDNCVKPDR